MPKTILITGASSGLGRAIAEAALASGHRVVGSFRDKTQLQNFGRAAPGRAIGCLLDVMTPLVKKLEIEHGPVDVLINNAGSGHSRSPG